MKNTRLIAVAFTALVILASGCGKSAQEELAEKQLAQMKQQEVEMKKQEEIKKAGEKALTSKKGFNPFKD